MYIQPQWALSLPSEVQRGNICEMFQKKGPPKSQSSPQRLAHSRFSQLPRKASWPWSVRLGRNQCGPTPLSCYSESNFVNRKSRKFWHRNYSQCRDCKGEISLEFGQLSQYRLSPPMLISQLISSCLTQEFSETRWWGAWPEKTRRGGGCPWRGRWPCRWRWWWREFCWSFIVIIVKVIIYTNRSVLTILRSVICYPGWVWWNIGKWFVRFIYSIHAAISIFNSSKYISQSECNAYVFGCCNVPI